MNSQRLSALCLLLATVLPPTGALAQEVTYDYATRLPTGPVTTRVFVSDLDADARLDLLYLRRGTGNDIGDFGVLMGNGNGSFVRPVVSEIGVRPFRGALGDVNNDGLPDLLVSNQTQLGLGNYRLTVVLGNGDGTFDLANAEVYPAAAFPNSVALDDINNDNKLDILYRTSNSNVLDVLTGNGDGTFDTAAAIRLGNQVTRVTSGDLNNDNRTDLIVIDNLNAPTFVKVLLATPGGAFAAAPSIALPGSGSMLSTAHLNGDTFMDLIVSDSRGDLLIGLGNGDGTFDALVPYAVTADPSSIVARDLDGNGALDLIVRHANSDAPFIAVLSGNGDGTFGDTQFLSLGSVQSVQVDDVDDDGRYEFVAVDSPNNEIIIVAGNDHGTFGQSFYHPADEAPKYADIADVNLDGKQDVVVVGDRIAVFLGNGDGSMVPNFDSPAGSRRPQGVALADFNRDGNIDMASPTIRFDSLELRLGAGNGTFGPAAPFLSSTEFPLGADLSVGDVDKDGDQDVAIAIQALELVSVARNNGSASFTSVTNYGGIGEPTTVALGDIDGDTILDLAIGARVFAPTGLVANIYVLEGRGDGTFKPPVVVSDAQNARGLHVVDVDNNGDADLVWSSWTRDDVSILHQRNDGTFDAVITVPVGRGPLDLSVADLNRDGRQDLVTSNAFDENVSLLLQNANGTFGERVLPAGQRLDSLAVKDVNDDGTPDLAIVTYFAGGSPRGDKHEALNIVLGNIAPEISSISSLPSNFLPGRVNFTVFASDKENDGLSVYWDFDGDGKADRRTAGRSTGFDYPESGTFDVGVRVVDDRGSSATAMTTVDVVVPDLQPEPPTDLTARAKSGTVNLSWTPSPDTDMYNIYRSVAPSGPYSLIAFRHVSSTGIFADNDVTDGQTYYYVVRATLNGVESADSNEAEATPRSRGRGR